MSGGMEWKPIESAPRDGTHILLFGGVPDHESDEYDTMRKVWWEGLERPVSGYWKEWLGIEGWRYCSYDSGYYGVYLNPTHWMPLPAPPEGCCDGGASGKGETPPQQAGV